jgi:Flp pilus assembly protein TadD
MMNRTAIRLAASTLVIGLTMVGCRTDPSMIRPETMAARSVDRQATQAFEQANQSLQRGQVAEALAHMERAVALSPRDAGYRLLLADIYLKSGRFQSAATTYGDVLELDPSNSRAALSFSLSQIANGRPQAALAQLDMLAGRAAPADVGLAYALAGQAERAIELMEPAARAHDASPRLRQNLALAYALAGDWERAQAVAAQDVSPGDLPARLQQWARFAQPEAVSDQVASLLRVTPAADPGQPVQLALNSEPTGEFAFAAAEPRQSEPVEIVAERHAVVHDLPAVEAPPPAVRIDWASAADTRPDPEEIRYVEAAAALTRPEPAVLRRASATFAPARDAAFGGDAIGRTARGEPGRFVVQLGAFSNAANAENAWVQAERRFGLRSEQPLTTTIDHFGRTLHRVSVAGFESRADANRLCESLRARGGSCFVREIAGDAPVRWAARYGASRA